MWLQGMNTRTTLAPEDWIRPIVAASVAGPGSTTPGMVAEALEAPISASAHAQVSAAATRRTTWHFPRLGIAPFLGTGHGGLQLRRPCLARRRGGWLGAAAAGEPSAEAVGAQRRR